jgi:hypothetical protein
MRRMTSLIRAVFFCVILLSPASLFAASNYSENFNTGALSWQGAANGNWSVVSGYYTNALEPQQTIATYSGDTWTTNYTYTLRIYSDNGASGNRLGVVFGYVSDTNYYRLLINMQGSVVLEKVTGTSVTTPTGGTGNVGALAQNTWYPLQLVLTGNRLIVRVNNEIALDNVDITGIAAGRIGLITQWDESRFDDLSVLLNTAYSQNFSGTALPSGWNADLSTWNVTGGYLANTVNNISPAIATYNGVALTTDYTYRVRAYSDHGASANTVGVVFAYQNSDNYYELVTNVLGTVTVNRVVNGQPAALVVTGDPVECAPTYPATTTCIPRYQFFDIELVLKGSTLSATVMGTRVLNDYAIGTLPAGRVGVITRWNFGRFDDVLLVSPATGASANLLFRSGFDNTMTIHTEDAEECSTNTCFVDVTGVDSVTGFDWASPYLWGGIGRFKPTTGGNLNLPAQLAQYITNERRFVAGPNTTQTQVLYQSVNQIPPDPTPNDPNDELIIPQDPYIIQDMTSTGARNDLYIRFWMKLEPNPSGTWRILTQWKTGGDYRVSVTIAKDYWCRLSTPQYHWRIHADNIANAPLPVDYKWEVWNTTVPVPLGQWFKLEFFTHRSTGSDGRVWVAVNGQTIADYNGSTKDTGEITRVMAPTLYTNDTQVPIEQWVDDLELWNGFPADASSHDGSATPTWQTCTNPPDPS